MSWSDRRTLLMLPLAALLTACGFSPVYGPDGTGNALRGRVEIAAPDTINSYILVQRLEEQLGRTVDPAYTLALTLATEQQGQAITANDETTRYSIVGILGYVLTEIATGRIVASGDVRNFTGYSATGSTVETLAAERDANRRLMVILADQLVAGLYATANLDGDPAADDTSPDDPA